LIDSCENSHVCYRSLLDSHGVQSDAINAQCNLGQSRALRPPYTPTLILSNTLNDFTQTG